MSAVSRWMVGSVCTCGVVATVAWSASASADTQILLTNQTDSTLLENLHQPQQTIMTWVTGGMAAADFNGDGLADVFTVTGGIEPDNLFINNGDGTFTEQASDWDLDAIHCGNGVAVGDYNGDGRLDMFVGSMGAPGTPDQPGHNRLYRNDGGSFAEVAADAGVNFASQTSSNVYGAAFGDYDLDGDLDLFVTTWENPGFEPQYGNRLFENQGDGTFDDVTTFAFPVEALEGVSGFQPAFVDMDRDLFPEILIAADFRTSRYLVNLGDGTFEDRTVASGTGLDSNGMGQTVGDFNRDGRLDWYVTSIHTVNPQPGINPGNMLYLAADDHVFNELSNTAGVNDGGWGWGTVTLDLDQDGWLDIVEVNGRETNPPGTWTNEPAKLFHNLGGAHYEEVAALCGLDHDESGRAIVKFDLENDGDMDVAVFTNAGGVDVYRNDTPLAGNWLQVTMSTRNNPLIAPNGFGTRVEATVDGITHVRFLDSSPSFLATSQLMLHFGLGAATVIDELSVFWTRGNVTVLENVAVNQRVRIKAPNPTDVNADGTTNIDDLVEVILRWGTGAGPADVDGNGLVNIDDLVAVVLAMGPA